MLQQQPSSEGLQQRPLFDDPPAPPPVPPMAGGNVARSPGSTYLAPLPLASLTHHSAPTVAGGPAALVRITTALPHTAAPFLPLPFHRAHPSETPCIRLLRASTLLVAASTCMQSLEEPCTLSQAPVKVLPRHT